MGGDERAKRPSRRQRLSARQPCARDRTPFRQPCRALQPGDLPSPRDAWDLTGLALWEVGVGGPSVPRWLAERVTPSGHVLATDIDVRWAQEISGDHVEVRRHD